MGFLDLTECRAREVPRESKVIPDFRVLVDQKDPGENQEIYLRLGTQDLKAPSETRVPLDSLDSKERRVDEAKTAFLAGMVYQDSEVRLDRKVSMGSPVWRECQARMDCQDCRDSRVLQETEAGMESQEILAPLAQRATLATTGYQVLMGHLLLHAEKVLRDTRDHLEFPDPPDRMV
jgi:hypothetical protein